MAFLELKDLKNQVRENPETHLRITTEAKTTQPQVVAGISLEILPGHQKLAFQRVLELGLKDAEGII